MELFHGIQALTRTLASPVVTIGNFDGVHLGHRQIIHEAIEKARAREGTVVVYTFRPHPQLALRPEVHLPLLLTYDEKIEQLSKLGVDVTIEEPFSREFSTTTPDQFFSQILLHRLNAQAIVVGYDFAFGKERAGHIDTLQSFCVQAGVELTVVQPEQVEGEAASSTRIRQHLQSGEIELANRLLGRAFFYRGIIERGEGRGRKIGFPTANLKPEGKLVLPYGVYATWAFLSSKSGLKRYPSVTNIGVRPTFQKQTGDSSLETQVRVETHLLDIDLDLYGRELEVCFVRRLREERRFDGIDSLRAQIAKDVMAAKMILE